MEIVYDVKIVKGKRIAYKPSAVKEALKDPAVKRIIIKAILNLIFG